MQAQQQLYLVTIIIARNSGASLILQAICYTFPVALLLHIYLYIQHGCTYSSMLAYHVSLHPVLIHTQACKLGRYYLLLMYVSVSASAAGPMTFVDAK